MTLKEKPALLIVEYGKQKSYIYKKSNYNIVMINKSELNKLSKKQLIDLLLKDQQK